MGRTGETAHTTQNHKIIIMNNERHFLVCVGVSAVHTNGLIVLNRTFNSIRSYFCGRLATHYDSHSGCANAERVITHIFKQIRSITERLVCERADAYVRARSLVCHMPACLPVSVSPPRRNQMKCTFVVRSGEGRGAKGASCEHCILDTRFH